MNAYILILLVMFLSFIVQTVLESKMKRYGTVATRMTGAQAAGKMLRENGILDVKVTCIPGKLTDHYDPTAKTVNLSEDNYSGYNLAAIAVAAHECGHAVQHATSYAPLKMRSSLVPFVSFASKTVQWVLLLGVVVLSFTPALLWLGIALFAATTLFSLITLPVEINASARAINWLDQTGLTDFETGPMAKDALKWAAYTYVIAALGSLATLFYYISIARNRQ